MDWIPIISTFGNFVIASMSIYLICKARTVPYKEMLNSKQLKGYIKIFNAFTDFYVDASLFFVAKS
ncbi:unnamed protein product [marine sediment metagenome]|uniref:Uncharacterized protein n=1 Tax=marine sediment metagenome TaxID=412755 RepID=X1B1E7_9ZZZZ